MWPRGEQWILFPKNLNVSCDEVEGNIDIRGKRNTAKQNKTKANFEKRAEIPATASDHLWSRATAVNISRVTMNYFPFDVIVFAMLLAHGIWNSFIVRCHVTMN